MCQMTRRITSAGGELTSPGYPGNYPTHVDCMCTLSADEPSARLVLSLYDVALQTKNGRCRADWLMLREGARQTQAYFLSFCSHGFNKMLIFSCLDSIYRVKWSNRSPPDLLRPLFEIYAYMSGGLFGEGVDVPLYIVMYKDTSTPSPAKLPWNQAYLH